MTPLTQYCLVGVLFLVSAIVMAISAFLGRTHSRLDVLVIVFSAISSCIACHQFWSAFMVWHAERKKSPASDSGP